MPWSPLARGILSGNYRGSFNEGSTSGSRGQDRERTAGLYSGDEIFIIVGRVSEVAKRLGYTPAQVSIAWLLNKPEITASRILINLLSLYRRLRLNLPKKILIFQKKSIVPYIIYSLSRRLNFKIIAHKYLLISRELLCTLYVRNSQSVSDVQGLKNLDGQKIEETWREMTFMMLIEDRKKLLVVRIRQLTTKQ